MLVIYTMYTALNTLAHKILPQWIYFRLISKWSTEGLKKYFSNAGWPILARTSGLIIAFVTTIYVTRSLGPENYGQLSYALSFVGLFGILASLGIDSVLYRDLVNHPEKRHLYLGTAFGIKLIMGIVTALVIVGSALTVVHDDVSRYIILILAPVFLGTALQTTLIGDFGGQVKPKYPSIIHLIIVFILNILKAGIIFLGGGVLYLGAVLLLEPFLYAALLLTAHHRIFGTFHAWKFNAKIAQELLYESWPFIFISAFTFIYSRIDQVMLKHMVGASATGIYDAAVRIAEVWYLFPSIIASSLFPAILNAKKTNPTEYRSRLLLLSGFLIIISLAFIIPLSLVSKPLIGLLYGSAFTASVAPFLIYLWAGIFASLDNVTHWYLLAEKKRKIIFFITALSAVINIGLNLILIPIYGPSGAAASTLVSYLILSFPLLGLMSRNKSGLPTHV